ncbi:uncharacterized protein K452DRAFT_300413 [Aplosporella prunicola CBS 121167]|uniref:Uncharacterized protein n=1 Tax=Aplosporella prunicola CBS 121167 TaxID=1176127 RepID=A0A6A6BA36_9PEZI|nr:uncharacterized protein K452DRAFT_300413 [Aplosporella prunicola CBS 121167]KAF2139361.1 hypothetical protein K452DRAFT_300413 [Aplosporella prunicola CBS 121167]
MGPLHDASGVYERSPAPPYSARSGPGPTTPWYDDDDDDDDDDDEGRPSRPPEETVTQHRSVTKKDDKSKKRKAEVLHYDDDDDDGSDASGAAIAAAMRSRTSDSVVARLRRPGTHDPNKFYYISKKDWANAIKTENTSKLHRYDHAGRIMEGEGKRAVTKTCARCHISDGKCLITGGDTVMEDAPPEDTATQIAPLKAQMAHIYDRFGLPLPLALVKSVSSDDSSSSSSSNSDDANERAEGTDGQTADDLYTISILLHCTGCCI